MKSFCAKTSLELLLASTLLSLQTEIFLRNDRTRFYLAPQNPKIILFASAFLCQLVINQTPTPSSHPINRIKAINYVYFSRNWIKNKSRYLGVVISEYFSRFGLLEPL